MRLVYVSGTYVPAAGGAEISAALLLRYLARQCTVIVVTCAHPPYAPGTYADERVTIHRVAHRKAGEDLVLSLLQGSPETIVLTQNVWADLALKAAKSTGVRCVYFARSAGSHLDLRDTDRFRVDLTVSNSEAVARFVYDRWGIRSPIVRSPVECCGQRLQGRRGSFITMVNPIALKGGFVFKAAASLLPERRFLVVRGWNHLRKPTGAWDDSLFEELGRGLGSSGRWQPEEPDFSSSGNVTVLPGVSDMREIYEQTRLLLVPSQASESCPRVAIEALCCGTPVIGSDVGGIPESLGRAGSIVKDFANPHAWAAAVVAADDDHIAGKAAAFAHEVVARHDPLDVSRRMFGLLSDLTPAS